MGDAATIRLLATRLGEPKIEPSLKRAAVALVFRLVGIDGEVTKRDLLQGDLDEASAELLYILRTSRAGDKWSGHVAFPGGKREEEDGSDRAAAVREVEEEVGLKLDEDFLFLGQLDDRVVTGGGRVIEGFYVAPLIWLQRAEVTPPISMQESEVAAWRWVPLSKLSPELVKFQVPLQLNRNLMPNLINVFPFRFSADVLMPCIDLEGSSTSSSCQFRLWGLTLRATSDALVLGGGLQRELCWPPLQFKSRSGNLLLGAWCCSQELKRKHRFSCRHLASFLTCLTCLAILLRLCTLATRRCGLSSSRITGLSARPTALHAYDAAYDAAYGPLFRNSGKAKTFVPGLARR